MSAVMLERAGARSYLEGVASGAAPLPLDPERELLVCSSLMAVMRPSFEPPLPAPSVAALFVAFLAHSGLSTRSLERVAMDGLCGHPDVFAALLTYPGLPDQLVVEAAMTAWRQSVYHSGMSDVAFPIRNLTSRDHPMDLHDRILVLLRSGGTSARLAARLLPAAASNDFFTCAALVLAEPPAVRDVVVTLLEDDAWRRQGIDPSRLAPFLERARLVVGP